MAMMTYDVSFEVGFLADNKIDDGQRPNKLCDDVSLAETIASADVEKALRDYIVEKIYGINDGIIERGRILVNVLKFKKRSAN